MTDITFHRTTPELARPAPPREKKSMREIFFSDLASAMTTLILAVVILTAVPQILSWAIFDSVWTGDPAACVDAGACWSFLGEKHPFILFGIYPPDERWRPLVVILLLIALALWTLPTAHWTRRTLYLWIAGVFTALLLMRGGVFGLQHVPTADWGGLPVTLLLTVLSLAISFPFAIVLALGRQSKLRIFSWASIGFIEIVRGLPLLSLLFITSIMLPLMLPEGITIDNLLRALAALTIYAAAFLAEVIRGGLQGVNTGQAEAARALGMRWVQTTRLIVLPQAIRKVIPPLTNTVVVVVKNTSLVLVIGLFDLLSAGRAALSDPDWPAPYAETYLFIAVIYFAICFGISRYSLWLEKKFEQGVQ